MKRNNRFAELKNLIIISLLNFTDMKKFLINTTILLSLFVFDTSGLDLELVPQSNYTFGGKIHSNFGVLDIQRSDSYGFMINAVEDDVSFQAEYFYQPSTGEYRDFYEPEEFNQNADLDIHWYHIGLRQRYAINKTVVPFFGVSVGLTHFILDSSPTKYDEIAFSFGIQGGVNFYVSKIIGFRVHGRILTPVQFEGFGFYAGTGDSGAQASSGSYFVQADLGVGIIIRIGDL